jgi:hypothetical protein
MRRPLAAPPRRPGQTGLLCWPRLRRLEPHLPRWRTPGRQERHTCPRVFQLLSVKGRLAPVNNSMQLPGPPEPLAREGGRRDIVAAT